MSWRQTENKIILIVRQTRLDELIVRFNTLEQARFYVEHLGSDFSDYQEEDRLYKKSVEKASASLSRLGRLQVVDRRFLPNFLFGPQDLVIALGQDGLVANVLKYLDGQPLIGVNPDIHRWEGVLLPFTVEDLDWIVQDVFTGKRPIQDVTMAQAQLNTGEILHGVNDLFIGPRTHTSARYMIRSGDQQEQHSSSGIIVSTGLGSTGWLRSIISGATGIASSVTGYQLPLQEDQRIQWNSRFMYFSVREPWPSKNSSANITFGTIKADTPLVLTSQMPENGVIFSDGIESDYIQFNSGTTATISLAEKVGRLVG